VLTAAHCAEDYKNNSDGLKVLFGRDDLTQPSPGQELALAPGGVKVHPEWGRHCSTFAPILWRGGTVCDYDVALLQLAQPTNQTFIDLPQSGVSGQVQGTVLGWGMNAFGNIDYKLKSASMTIQPDLGCEIYTRFVAEHMICTGSFLADLWCRRPVLARETVVDL
jgi:hypothetical protein